MHPINAQMREELEQTILQRYRKEMEIRETNGGSPSEDTPI